MKARIAISAVAASFICVSLSVAHLVKHPAREVYQQVHPSVYPVYVVSKQSKQLVSAGSSVAVSPSTLVTNCHVLKDSSHFMIESHGKRYPAKVLRGNKYRDVCLLQVKDLVLHEVPIRLSKTVHVGEQVYAIGNPKGSIKSITTGIISNKMPVEGGIWLQTDATISFGSSGGGLFDHQGQLIGVTTALQGRFGYALPTEWVLAQLKRTKTVKNNKAFFARDESAMTKKLAQVGSVALYKYMHGNCFALVSGKGWRGKKRGMLFWSPAEPGMVMLFPKANKVKDVISIVNHVLKSGAGQKQNMHQAKSWLGLGRKKYALYTLQEKGGIYPLLMTNAGNDLVNVIRLQKDVRVRFRDRFFPSGKVSYSFSGINSLLLSNNKQCGRSSDH